MLTFGVRGCKVDITFYAGSYQDCPFIMPFQAGRPM